ncbi:hypothetical protein TWF696_003159 [Orbilia brochopaga]|uniref:RZ-type domain-containing protein n=1 Tax=Orbilia brochopaga TaxID=3140254 RepID=A0AAV9TZ82_9PEZI
MADQGRPNARQSGQPHRRRQSNTSNRSNAGDTPSLNGNPLASSQNRYHGRRPRNQPSQQYQTHQLGPRPHGNHGSPVLSFRGQPRYRQNNYHTNNENNRPGTELSVAALQEFLDAGIDRIECTEDSRNAFIGQLASQSGLEKVRQLLETEYSTAYSILKPTFQFHCVRFLRILSNEAVLRALSLEQQIRTIYNVVYGFNGERAIPFFTRTVSCLTALQPNDDDQSGMDQDEWNEALRLATTVFLNILRMNQNAALQPGLQDIGRQLAKIANTDDMTPGGVLSLIHQDISNILSILTGGAEVPIGTQRFTKKDPSKRPRGPANEEIIDLPGRLSALGPRHDNDHELISDISILPTKDEIISDYRLEFLPTRRAYELASQHHQEGVRRLIDIQFRLLREDTSGQLRDAARFILQYWNELTAPVLTPRDWSVKRKLVRDLSPSPIRMYFGISIQRLHFEVKTGLEVAVEFDQSRAVRRFTAPKRHWWWRKSAELRESKSIVALIEKTGEDANVIFFIVAKRTVPSHSDQSNNDEGVAEGPVNDLSTHPERAMITLRLVTLTNPQDQAKLVGLAMKYSTTSKQPGLLMVEFPRIIYKSYEGILRCLKFIHENPTNLPFGKWLAPRLDNSAALEVQDINSPVPPPAYLSGATLDFSACFADPENANHTVPANSLTFSLTEGQDVMVKNLAERSPLDHGQAKALVSAFSHEISLTQGPPGCGKSYVGVKMVVGLLANKASLGLGPILCICYTNHALDQFLNELLKAGIKNIARIGSPSPISHIEALSFDTYKKAHQSKVRGLGHQITTTRTELNGIREQISEICSKLEAGSVVLVQGYLEEHFGGKLREIVDSPFPCLSIGPETENSVPRPLELWLEHIETAATPVEERSLDELFDSPAWSLAPVERLRLYQHWHQSAIDKLTQRLQYLTSDFDARKKVHTSLFLEGDKKCLEQVDILGITTVGLVNNHELIRTLPAKVIVCEEAGEVLESHILTALIPSVQHAILIGDHLQLRPKISSRLLSKEKGRDGGKYNLDESLFERLANAQYNVVHGNDDRTVGFPIGQLNIQRRMHPSIANLVRTTLYPELEDHKRTTLYPEVAGVKRRLFWLDHRNYEDPSDPSDPMESMSKTNKWEARMVVALVTYLARQGVYKAGQIAVLTPYVNQMRILMEMLENIIDYEINERDLEDLELDDDEAADGLRGNRPEVKQSKVLDRVRMATVDNFQGEEAEIIIVSLVRSNDRKECGFLRTPNRINVLLSRAKHGMYIIGDATTSMNVPMWHNVIELFEQGHNFGPKLQLHCTRHPEKKTFVGSPEDFESQCPEGGCAEKCGLRLRCGHSCEFKCHPKLLHDGVRCPKDCSRPRNCGHPCRRKCFETCGICPEMVYNVGLPCGHVAARMPCWQRDDPSRYLCQEMVMRIMSVCNHQVKVRCFRKTDPNVKCTEKCGATLPCGHPCLRSCSECRVSGTHGMCTKVCGLAYSTCQHDCKKTCHKGPCPPCGRPCEVRCKHGKCPNKCGEACFPCAEVCGWECEHQKEKCNMPCSVPCNKLPCDKRCEKLLPGCKHQCPSVCGEKCPPQKYCRECATPAILGRRIDYFMLLTYEEVDLDEDPVVFLGCGHYFTMSNLDDYFELEKYYSVNREIGRPRVLLGGEALRGCPDCRHPLRHIDRYNRVFKTVLLDELTKRFVARSTSQYADLMQKLRDMESKLEKQQQELIEKVRLASNETIGRKLITTYKQKSKHLWRLVQQFKNSVAKTEQPLAKVNALYASALAKQTKDDSDVNQSFDFDQSKIETGITYRADCLAAKAQCMVLWDWYTISMNRTITIALRNSLHDAVAGELNPAIKQVTDLRKDCQKVHLPGYEVEARIYHALFSILKIQNDKAKGITLDTEVEAGIRTKESNSLAECEVIARKFPGTAGRLHGAIGEAKKLVQNEIIYSHVTSAEENIVVAAMAARFSGAGDWYYCINGHPFTIGEGGMPMEEARCPECGQPVGGRNQMQVSGVRSVTELEESVG